MGRKRQGWREGGGDREGEEKDDRKRGVREVEKSWIERRGLKKGRKSGQKEDG